jgi:hypothetical protein
MTRGVLLSVGVAVMATASGWLWAAAPAFQGLPADYQAGRLKLPLTVHERSGVARQGAVVTSGVPFPPGFLGDVGRLGVVDRNGKPVVSQATVMLTWHKPAYDDSVQWALVSFLADVPAGGTSVYFLTDDGQAASPASPLTVTRTDAALTVETGVASFVVPMRGEPLISRASIGGAEVIGGRGLRPTLTAGDWAERGLKAGDQHIGMHEPAGVTVEESGAARVVAAIKGAFAPGDKERRSYDYTARLYFAAGSPAVRVVYTLSNGRLDPAFYPTADGKGKSRFAYVWPISDASLVADLAAAGQARVGAIVDDRTVSEALADGALTVHQSALDACRVTRGGTELAAGTRGLGVLDVSAGGRGLAVARRFFQEEWPGVLDASARQLRIGLFPSESGTTFHLNHGQRKSWDLRLTLHGAEQADLKKGFDEQDALLLFRPDPAWMVYAGGQTGAWSAGLALTPAPARMAMRRQSATPGGPRKGAWGGPGGWDGFGVISSWNAGGAHWNEQTAFYSWVVHGDGARFDNSEIPTLWAADHCPIHFDQPDMDVFFPYTANGTREHCRLKVLTYPAYKNRDTWGRPDTGHMGMWMWVEYYLLTGDARCREAVCHLGDMARGALWRYTHEERKDGAGALTPGQFPVFRKFDPDAEPDFKLDTRYVGWPLYCLAQYYQFTGEPALLEEARIIARAFRNTARACPIGQLVKDAAGKNGTERTEYSATFGFPNGNGGVASQVREWSRSASLVASNFYNGIMMYGLREYYLVSKDVEALDTLVGQIDRFCHHTLIHDPSGKPVGWSYIFADYWGPYTWEDSFDPKSGKSAATFSGSNALVSDALARIYPLTGRADLLDVLRLAQTSNAGSNATVALAMATTHPKVDQTPPAGVKDLSAEALGGGKVRLSWTAPADAAWYQVKYSPAKIVERVTGWPDRTEPLPGTRSEWNDRAAAFNARQRAFWAACNLAGAPAPAAAGTKQSMVVEGLPAGTLTFAVKSWDAVDNLSDLSNIAVVKVE